MAKKRSVKKPRGKVIAKREVLERFTPAELAKMEARASRELSARELGDLSAAADAAFFRVEQIKQLLARLKALRQAQGMTQAQVDERSGIGRANVSRLENLHLENPSLETLMRYAEAVGAELYIALQPKSKKSGRSRKPAA
jgi:predicted XRE-type DNA-binding protein